MPLFEVKIDDHMGIIMVALRFDMEHPKLQEACKNIHGFFVDQEGRYEDAEDASQGYTTERYVLCGCVARLAFAHVLGRISEYEQYNELAAPGEVEDGLGRQEGWPSNLRDYGIQVHRVEIEMPDEDDVNTLVRIIE